jgi:hypothetical protein
VALWSNDSADPRFDAFYYRLNALGMLLLTRAGEKGAWP